MSIQTSNAICFFEDPETERFNPLLLTRPMDDLRAGILTIREKWLLELGTVAFLRLIRPELANLFESEARVAPPQYWINSRLLPDPVTVRQIRELPEGGSIVMEGTLLVLRVASGKNEITESLRPEGQIVLEGNGTPLLKSRHQGLLEMADEPLRQDPDGDIRIVNHLWDLIRLNGLEIERDMERLSLRGSMGDSLRGVHLAGEHLLYASPEAVVEPGVAIITDEGPVYIGPGARIMAGSTLRGPVAVCEGSTVKMGARMYGNTTIGPVCKVAGEVQDTIFHSYSNKAHDGFVGSSLIGQWCNLGAGTSTSNLKNNYQTVRLVDWSSGEEFDTGVQFLGTVMGDHSKTGIHTMLSTGTLCGVCCNIFGSGFAPRLIPSFSWVDSGTITAYRIDKALETMQKVMERRNVELDEPVTAFMRSLFAQGSGG
ncbi:MAG: putative sugar nucleotidyl transferase [Balneolaceae bacterium]